MTLSEFYKRVHKTYNKTTYLVHLRIKYAWEKEYRDLNQLYEYDDELAQYMWSVDWYEGQECVEVVGFIDIADIKIPDYKGKEGGKRMTDEEKFLCRCACRRCTKQDEEECKTCEYNYYDKEGE